MNIKKIITRIFCLLVILLLCMVTRTCGREDGTFGELVLWFEEKTTDNYYSIYCEKYINTPPYSKQMIDVWIRKIGRNSVEYGEIKIDNRGKELDESNYEIEWTASGAILTFKGWGQSPVSYVIEWEKAFPDFEKEVKYWEETD